MNNEKHSLRRRDALQLLGALALNPAAVVAAPGFPEKPIRLILPFSAGSSTDFLSRLVAEQLGRQLKQPVIVDNKPGAAGVIGTQMLARSSPDGYTIGLVSLAPLAMVPPTLKDPPYDALRDFAPLSSIASTDLVLVAGPRAHGKTLAEFIDWGRTQKEPLFLGTLGAGTTGHLTGFLFGQAAKVKFEPVHFKSFSDLMPAMISGSVDVTVVAPSQILPFVREGKLRGLAITGPSRFAALSDVPTFKEAGFPDMQFTTWLGLAAPARTPTDIVQTLSAEIIKVANSPAVRAKLEEGGFRMIASTREEFTATIRKDVATWSELVKTSGFKV